MTRLGVEALEARALMAAALTAWLDGSVLQVEGTDGADSFAVTRTATEVFVTDYNAGAVLATFDAAAVSAVEVNALGGDDYVEAWDQVEDGAVPVHVHGGEGADTLYGSFGTALHGDAGDDYLYGWYWAALDGGDGADTLDGAAASDAYDALDTITPRDGEVIDPAPGGEDEPVDEEPVEPPADPVTALTASTDGWSVYVTGTDAADQIRILQTPETVQVIDDATGAVVASFDTNSVPGGYVVDALGGDDTVTLDDSADPFQPRWMTVYAGDGNDTVAGGNGHSYFLGGEGDDLLYGGAGVKYLIGEGGNDTLTSPDQASTNFTYADGGLGDDYVVGAAGDDYLYGGDGADWVFGQGGNDQVSGDGGIDTLYGGTGDDTVSGGADTDYVYGDDHYVEGGADVLDGGTGVDVLDGQGGDDALMFSVDATWAYGAALTNGYHTFLGQNRTYDYYIGGDGADVLRMTDGHDVFQLDDPDFGLRLEGVEVFEALDGMDYVDLRSPAYAYGDATIHGGASHDNLYGNAGNDALHGNAGDDWLEGGDGDDTMYFSIDGSWGAYQYSQSGFSIAGKTYSTDMFRGGAGLDTVVLTETDDVLLRGPDIYPYVAGVERVAGNGGNDVIDFAGGADASPFVLDGGAGNDSIAGGSGNDTINGGDQNDLLFGGAGMDSVSGDGGRDTVYGQADTDQLFGGTEGDYLVGGDDDAQDNMWGGAGDDTLYGGAGADNLFGENGQDWLSGEGGQDWLWGGWSNDWLYGGADIDVLLGEDGHDLLSGGGGDDWLYGDGEMWGNDSFYGNEGNDRLYGDAGGDWLDAGSAWEFADGGTGFDFNAYTWVVNGARWTDVVQGDTAPTCWLMSAMSSAALRGIDFAPRISYLGNNTYRVELFNTAGQWMTQNVIFDGNFTSMDAEPDVVLQEGEFWTILVQRAYLLSRGLSTTNPPSAGPGGFAGGALTAFTGRATTWYGAPVGGNLGDTHLALIASAIAQGRNVCVDTFPTAAQLSTGLLVANHVYTVVRIDSVLVDAGQWQHTVILRNPWGTDTNGGASSGDPNDGIVAVPANDFFGSMNGFWINW